MSKLVENVLEATAAAAKGAVQNTVDWAYGPNTWKRNRQQGGDKSDPVFNAYPLDTLRRAAYHSVFDTLFQSPDPSGYPYVVADKTLKDVVDRLNNLIFPTGTVFKPTNDALEELLEGILKQTRFQLKTEKIVEESAVLGYCGLRSVWDADAQAWLYEIKPKEYLIVETPEGKPEQIDAIGLEWPIIRVEKGQARRYWKKERWTLETYEVWREKPEKTSGQKPEFKPEDLESSEPNTYGELPITLVPHYFDPECQGFGIVGPEEVLSAKALIRLHHKRHFAHLKYMDPNLVRKNHADKTEKVELSIGAVIDIQQVDEKPVDLVLLESSGIPESAGDEFYEHVKSIYKAAGLKPPPQHDDTIKTGTNSSGVALRLLDKDDFETIKTLRDNGYSQVTRHFEKLLRMGARLGLPDYAGINPEDAESYGITVKYPDFFPPTDDEIALKLANFKAANLPANIMAQMIGALFGIEDPAIIKQIADGIDKERDLLEPTPLIPGGR